MKKVLIFVLSVLPMFASAVLPVHVDPILVIPTLGDGNPTNARESYHGTFDVMITSSRIVDGVDDYLTIRFLMQGQPDVFIWGPNNMSYETIWGWSSVSVNGQSSSADSTQGFKLGGVEIPFKYGEMFSLDVTAEASVGYDYHAPPSIPLQQTLAGLRLGTTGSGSFVNFDTWYTSKDAGALIQIAPTGETAAAAAAIPEPQTWMLTMIPLLIWVVKSRL